MSSSEFKCPRLSKAEIVALREKHLSPSLSLSYSNTATHGVKHGLHIVRGAGQYLFDASGTRYLDCRNNVQHLGHSHPVLTAAASQQMALLNTNTRYLHESTALLAQRLTALLPSPLDIPSN